MKLLRIRLQNLNSLRDRHELDMETGPLGGAGLFAITGPTGAGKSTLLDAITLALYGRAARYSSTANPEDMMSRHTGECEAEVTFAVPQGVYRATWQLRRAKGDPEGKLQPAKRALYAVTGDPGGDPVLATQIRDVEEQIVSLTGLNYEQFLRSVLLAQGEFSRFLKAKPDERAELLESLTATGIYSELSTLVYQEVKRRDLALQATEAELGRVVLLTDAERVERETALTALDQQQKEWAGREAALAAQDRAGAELAEQSARLAAALAAQDRLREAREAAADEMTSLARDAAAAPFFPALAVLDAAQEQAAQRVRQHAGAVESADQAAAVRGRMESAGALYARRVMRLADEAQAKAGAALTDSRVERDAAAAWLEAHAGDRMLTAAMPELASLLTSLENARAAEQVAQKRLSGLSGEAAQAAAGERSAAETLTKGEGTLALAVEKEKAADAALQILLGGRRIEDLQTLRDQLSVRREALRELQRLSTAAEAAAAALREGTENRTTLTDSTAAAKALAGQATERQTVAEKLVEACQAQLEAARRVAALTEHRHELSDGEPCPLCGSVDHPWADQAPESRLPVLERELQAARSALSEAAAANRKAHTEATRLDTELAGLTKRIAVLTGEESAARAALGAWARENAPPEGAIPAAVEACEESIRAATEGIRAVTEARDRALSARNTRLEAASMEREARAMAGAAKEKAEALRRQADAAAEEARQAAEALDSRRAALSGQLAAAGAEMGAEEAPGALRERLLARCQEFARREQALAAAAGRAGAAESALQQATARREVLAVRCAPLEREVSDEKGSLPDWPDVEAALAAVEAARRTAETAAHGEAAAARAVAEAQAAVEQETQSLTEKLAGSLFECVAALRSSRLPQDRRATLAARQRKWDEEAVTLTERARTCRAEVEKLRAGGAVEGEARVALTESLAGVRAGLARLRSETEEVRLQLRQDTANRELQASRTAELAETRARLTVWRHLGGLIGSGNGAKFRKFAQGISLDLLLARANGHLERLSERYRMRRGGEELEIVIEDLFQAATRRPMASLSGGETFLASLALALGLSDMAGRNVQIDSLFIDEGFGSLDANTLDLAITALETLRLDRKTIGVISHVSLLTERITTRVIVEKGANGFSRLIPPGQEPDVPA